MKLMQIVIQAGKTRHATAEEPEMHEGEEVVLWRGFANSPDDAMRRALARMNARSEYPFDGEEENIEEVLPRDT